MPAGGVMARAVALGTAVDTLAALAAYIRVETEQLPADPVVHAVLRAIAAEVLGDPDPTSMSATAAPVVGLARTFVGQAAELIDHPGRSGSWDQVDVPLLQSMGRMSMAIVEAFAVAEQEEPALAERMAAPAARFLDVGTGAGWLAIAVARTHPRLHVVGLDIFPAALDLARANVAEAGLSGRIDLQLQDVTALHEPDGYDVGWLPMPFLPAHVVPGAVETAVEALRPGGWLLLGTFAGPPDRLSELLTDLRTVRAGGHPWRAEELVAALSDAGLSGAREIPRTWAAPVRLYAARRG